MKIHRIYGMVLRYMFLFKHNYSRLTDAFYWPVIDLFLWGLASVYFRNSAQGLSQFILVILSGLLLWVIIWRAQYEVSVNLLEDLWNKNLINIFASPLKFKEWIASFMVIGIIKCIVSFGFASFVAYLMYKIQLFSYGFYLIPFMILLIMSGWAIGFFVGGLLLRYGTKVETLAWAFAGIISPLSAVFYPVSVLPAWAQKISMVLPTTYIFEGSREIIFKGVIDPNKIFISLGLNLFYLFLSLWFINRSFKKALQKGLISLF